eukprot:1593021-Lingulodinium_polyedra.AAC.1
MGIRGAHGVQDESSNRPGHPPGNGTFETQRSAVPEGSRSQGVPLRQRKGRRGKLYQLGHR